MRASPREPGVSESDWNLHLYNATCLNYSEVSGRDMIIAARNISYLNNKFVNIPCTRVDVFIYSLLISFFKKFTAPFYLILPVHVIYTYVHGTIGAKKEL